jgi:hypothetical protein
MTKAVITPVAIRLIKANTLVLMPGTDATGTRLSICHNGRSSRGMQYCECKELKHPL